MEPIMTPAQIAELLSRQIADTSEELDSHRRGHWFESSIAHLLTGLFHQFRDDIVMSVLDPGRSRILELKGSGRAPELLY